MKKARWSILFRSIGRNQRQKRKRFIAPDNLEKAKTIGLALIGDGDMYEGLFRWSNWDFDTAVKRARMKLARKRRDRAERKTKAAARAEAKAMKELLELTDEELTDEELADEELVEMAMDSPL